MTDRDKLKKKVEERLSFPDEETPEVTSLNTITTPLRNAGDNLGSEKIKMESAGLIGAISDQVLTGSPAAEYGSTGRFALDGMIKASERIAREKYQTMNKKEEK
ncbi:hypothetical protein BBF96_14210 [Anoxybacter fermentans]|uniref:Uncharacterized protein n=1 Tax=Anoxybacter fermentans TaxID=1323375 RepID=A0A3S9T1J7_9FIRM|nr:hypothetical protein [Anoxybacter fermentans]AZR74438.1 hypothetical protein BBF96_14210 [Anoxybacter fermentans]